MQEAHPSGAPLLRLLFVDNAHTDYTLLVRFIEHGGYAIQSARVETAAQMREALFSASWDAVISELDLPGFPLVDVLTVLRESAFDTPLIVVTGTGEEHAAVEAMVAGADDYVSKSSLIRLLPALKRAIVAAVARRTERAERARLWLQQSQMDPDPAAAIKTVVMDLHETLVELAATLATDITWFAENAADAAAAAHAQNMQQALDRARARAAYSMRLLQPPPAG